MNTDQAQWDYLQQAINQQRLPQALLCVGPLHANLQGFAKKLMAVLLCNATSNQPCTTCNDCQMVQRDEHPDSQWIRPEKTGAALKIDQIRELQHSAFLTPQRAAYRVIAIVDADKMNTAAANALLKILEEPPVHSIFILLTQQLSTVLPTIISRCQVLRFAGASMTTNLLELGAYYPEQSERYNLTHNSESLLDNVIAVMEGQEHPCAIAAQWSQLEFSSLLWFLYLVIAQVQYLQSSPTSISGRAVNQLQILAAKLLPRQLFILLDLVMDLTRKTSNNLPVNTTLALENVLLGFSK